VINSGIENCILLEFSMVKDVAHLEDSLLGKHSLISKNGKGRSVRAHIGDYSEVEV